MAACVSVEGDISAPDPVGDVAVRLETRAFWRACEDVICAGTPIYAPGDTPAAVQQALKSYTDEVAYIDPSSVEERTGDNGIFVDGGIMISVDRIHGTERGDVFGVNVWITRGCNNGVRRTYLFRWDGDNWVDATPDGTGVTVTSAVS